MKSTFIMFTTALFTILIGCISDTKPHSTQKNETKMELTQKEKAVALLNIAPMFKLTASSIMNYLEDHNADQSTE